MSQLLGGFPTFFSVLKFLVLNFCKKKQRSFLFLAPCLVTFWLGFRPKSIINGRDDLIKQPRGEANKKASASGILQGICRLIRLIGLFIKRKATTILSKKSLFFFVFGMDSISSFFCVIFDGRFFFNGETSNPFCPLPPWIRMPSDSIKVQWRTIPLKTMRRRHGTNLRVSQSQSLGDFEVCNFGGRSRSVLCKSLDKETFIGSMVVSIAPACPKIVASQKSLNPLPGICGLLVVTHHTNPLVPFIENDAPWNWLVSMVWMILIADCPHETHGFSLKSPHRYRFLVGFGVP